LVRIATIGVYCWTLESLLTALRVADVRVVLDVRQRRGVRGPEYAWANSARLRAALASARIEYRHHKELAPTTDLRHLQYDADAREGVGKRSRLELAPEYRERYQREILDRADLGELVRKLPADGLAALLCVERDPETCHRSLIAERLEAEYGVSVVHLHHSGPGGVAREPPRTRSSAGRRSLYDNGITIDREVTMKGASKPKKLGKKVAQKSLKEKRQEKRAASKKGFGSS
jgi:uncharacterized protein (DUF488 family)